jgi:hypothetical protein
MNFHLFAVHYALFMGRTSTKQVRLIKVEGTLVQVPVVLQAKPSDCGSHRTTAVTCGSCSQFFVIAN